MDPLFFIDTHCHLDMTMDGSPPQPIRTMYNAALSGVGAVIQIAVDGTNCHWNRKLSETYQADLARFTETQLNSELPEGETIETILKKTGSFRYYWTAGLHPETASFSGHKDTETAFRIIKESRDDPSFVGIGECGLDYFHSRETAEVQKEVFEKHLKLAADLDLPVVLHLRDDRVYNPEKTDAVKDALKLVKKYGINKGILHCYTYGYEEAMPFAEKGWMVSFSGIITYKNTDVVQDAARRLPDECLLIETDAPFLAPVPHRGKPNESALLPHTFETLAALRFSKDYRPADNKSRVTHSDLASQDLIALKNTLFRNSNKFTGWKNNA